MKSLLQIILCILSTVASAQTILIGSFSVGIPKNATKLDPNKFQQQATVSSAGIQQITSKTPNLYTIDNATLGFWVVNSSSNDERKSMIDRKNEVIEVYKLPSSYKLQEVVVSQVNGNSFLVVNYDIEGKYYYRFYSDYINHTALNGVLEYKKEDEVKAKATLTEVLSGISAAN